ncbi:MAG: aldo/keto reductase [Candidatus Bathyarchaeia archaeon]
MKYRSFGRLNWKVSVLGFGTMRLPIKGKDQSNVDEAQAINLLHYAIDQGVNYVDTAYPYHDGSSEVVVGKAITSKYREKVKIATKMPMFHVNNKEDLDYYFNQQLKRLNTNFIDFYLLHALNRELWKKTQDLDVIRWAEEKISQGKIGYLGFSFHDDFEVFKEIVDSYNWTMCQIQYNYLDETYQAGKRGLQYAASKAIAVSIMEPLAGGLLAVNPPKEIKEQWSKASKKRSAADWALTWIWNHPEVSTALSGMGSMQQLKENLQTADRSEPNSLTIQELDLITKSRDLYLEVGYIGCTCCRYCTACKQGVDIPAILALLNESATKRGNTDFQEQIKRKYAETIPEEKRANHCQNCGACEEICPQHLPIRKLLAEAVSSFG